MILFSKRFEVPEANRRLLLSDQGRQFQTPLYLRYGVGRPPTLHLLRFALLLFLMPLVLSSEHANAQVYDPRNPLGAILNGVGANLARQQAVAAAHQAWGTVDPTMYQCLMQTLSPSPPALANSGIQPGDPRLVVYFQRCANSIAQAQTARDADARRAAEEEQRRQAELEAQKEEQQRLAAEERAQKQAAEEARRADEQRPIAEQRAEAIAFSQVQTMQELSSYLGRSRPDLVFLQVNGSRRLVRGLDGKITLVGQDRPVACWPFPTTGASSAGFFLWAMSKLQALTGATRFELMPCTDSPLDFGQADVVLFSTGDMVVGNAQRELAIGQFIRSGQLHGLLEVRQDDYDAKVAADRQHDEETAAQAKAISTEADQAIESNATSGVGILEFDTKRGQSACVGLSVDPEVVAQAVAKSANEKIAARSGAIRNAQPLSPDDIFIHIKAGQCGLVAGDIPMLHTIRDALRRDGFPSGISVEVIATDDLKNAEQVVTQQHEAQRNAQALAKQAEAKKVADEQAAAALAAAARAENLAKKRDAAESSSQLVDHP